MQIGRLRKKKEVPLTPKLAQLRDLQSSIDPLTWSHWVSFARGEKHRRKKKGKEKKSRGSSSSPPPPSSPASSRKVAVVPSVPVLDQDFQRSSLKEKKLAKEKSEAERRDMQQKLEDLSESLTVALDRNHNEAEKHRIEMIASNENTMRALEELKECRSSLSTLQSEYSMAADLSSLFNSKEAAEAALEQAHQQRTATWRMAEIRAAFLRLRSAELAADSACCSASALQTFLSSGNVQSTPGLQQVVSALSAAADAQQNFRNVASSAASALAPLIDEVRSPRAENEIGSNLLDSSWEAFERECSQAVVEIQDEKHYDSPPLAAANVANENAKKNNKNKSNNAKKDRTGSGKTTTKLSPSSRRRSPKASRSVSPKPFRDAEAGSSVLELDFTNLQLKATHLKNELSLVKNAMNACVSQVNNDMEHLSSVLAASMCKIMDGERNSLTDVAAPTKHKHHHHPRSPTGRGSPLRNRGDTSPISTPAMFHQRQRRRNLKKFDGGVRICAHIKLASPGHLRKNQTPLHGCSNVKILNNHVELGLLTDSDVDILRVNFSRVFALHNERFDEAFFNRNVVAEVRPSIVNAVLGDGE